MCVCVCVGGGGREREIELMLPTSCCSIDTHTLQVTGEENYIHGKVELIAFRDIRR